MKGTVKRIHLIGIGGTGMSGIAELLLAVGFEVSGSDLSDNPMTRRLQSLGATIYKGHKSEAVGQADVVVISSAINTTNVEVKTAKEARIPVISRAEMLSELMRFKRGIAIAGTHGKTTTTSMVATVLAHAGLDPTYVIGGLFNAISSNAKLGQGDYLVAEADESDSSFLQLQPVISVVTNIDEDHMQTYANDRAILDKAFVDFLNHLPFWGLAILCIDDAGVKKIIHEVPRRITTYGFDPSADYQASNVSQEGFEMSFNLSIRHIPHGRFSIKAPGVHNVSNALAAVAIADELGIEPQVIREGLAAFEGVGRRFEVLDCLFNDLPITWVDDYAHHPKAIEVTWEAAQGCWPNQRKLLIFQPHRYSRVTQLFEDFVRALSLTKADYLILMDVYSAGEDPINGGDSQALAQAIRSRGESNLIQVKDDGELKQVLSHLVVPDDVIVSMGAGNISSWMKSLITPLSELD